MLWKLSIKTGILHIVLHGCIWWLIRFYQNSMTHSRVNFPSGSHADTMAATFDWWRTEVTQVIITGNVFIPKTFSSQRIDWWNWYWDKICFESICIVYECECEFVCVVFNGTFNENKNGTSRIRTIPCLILWSKENKKKISWNTNFRSEWCGFWNPVFPTHIRISHTLYMKCNMQGRVKFLATQNDKHVRVFFLSLSHTQSPSLSPSLSDSAQSEWTNNFQSRNK